MIVGRIGSGKTAFLNAILNEMDIKEESFNINNTIKINGSIAYVS